MFKIFRSNAPFQDKRRRGVIRRLGSAISIFVVATNSLASTYSGFVKNREVTLLLNWRGDGTVDGRVEYHDASGERSSLRGDNYEEGKLVLEELVDGKVRNKWEFQKHQTESRVFWSAQPPMTFKLEGVHGFTWGPQIVAQFSKSRNLPAGSFVAGGADVLYRCWLDGRQGLFRLDWTDPGRIEGDFTFDDTGEKLRAVGINAEKGRAEFRLYKQGELHSVLAFEKVSREQSIIWRGNWYPIDAFPCDAEMARPRDLSLRDLTSWKPVQDSDYIGSIAGQNTNFAIAWHSDGRVAGDATGWNGGTQFRYQLKGVNVSPGELAMDLFRDHEPNRLHGVARLRKEVVNDLITWRGKVDFVDGRQSPIAFGRPKSGEWDNLPRIIPGESIRVDRITTLVLPLTVWKYPPGIDQVFNESDRIRDGSGGYAAKLLRSSHSDGKLVLDFELAPFEEERGDREVKQVVPSERRTKLVIEYPNRSMPFYSGQQWKLHFSSEGEIEYALADRFGITHWRRNDDGDVEVKGLLESKNPESRVLTDRGFLEYVRLPPLEATHFRPDKMGFWDLKASNSTTMRLLALDRVYGLCLYAGEAGSGILELESVSLEEKESWYALGESYLQPEIPRVQWMMEGG